jgi:undecaprenyl-diphosphatase
MDKFLVFDAPYLFIGSFIISLVYFFKLSEDERIKLVIRGLVTAICSYGIALLAGHLYDDPRPFVVGHFKPLIAHDTENGFPSDHILLLSVIASVCTLQTKKAWTALLWVITFTVAYARVYVGVHHYIDVLASILIAVVVSIVVFKFLGEAFLNQCTSMVKSIIAKVITADKRAKTN